MDHFTASIENFTDWLPYSGRHKSAKTVRQYATAARRLAYWACAQGRHSFADLTAKDLRAFLSSLRSRDGGPASAATKATNWWAIRALAKYLAEEEGVPDIAARITVGRPPEGDRITHLDQHEVARLLNACSDPRETAVISVALDCGLRISELVSLQVADIAADDDRARHLIVRGKGGKVRGVVIGLATARALRQYLRWRAKSPHAHLPDLWLSRRGKLSLTGMDKLIRRVGENAGLDVHPHLLRHTWAHQYRLGGGQTDNLCYLAGWSGPAMALRYGASAAAERAEAEALSLSLVDRMRGRS